MPTRIYPGRESTDTYIHASLLHVRIYLRVNPHTRTRALAYLYSCCLSPCAQKRSGRRSLSEYFPSNLISPGGAQYARYLARPEDERGDSDGKKGRGCIADITMRGGFSRGRLEVCFARGRNRNVGKFFLDSPLLSRHAPPFTADSLSVRVIENSRILRYAMSLREIARVSATLSLPPFCL